MACRAAVFLRLSPIMARFPRPRSSRLCGRDRPPAGGSPALEAGRRTGAHTRWSSFAARGIRQQQRWKSGCAAGPRSNPKSPGGRESTIDRRRLGLFEHHLRRKLDWKRTLSGPARNILYWAFLIPGLRASDSSRCRRQTTPCGTELLRRAVRSLAVVTALRPAPSMLQGPAPGCGSYANDSTLKTPFGTPSRSKAAGNSDWSGR